MFRDVEDAFPACMPDVEYCTLRVVQRRCESLVVRRGVVLPGGFSRDTGAMITVVDREGFGYAATCDLSSEGLKKAGEEALAIARMSAGRVVVDPSSIPWAEAAGEYESPVKTKWNDVPLAGKLDLLKDAAAGLRIDESIVDWVAACTLMEMDMLFLSTGGARITQRLRGVLPAMTATASREGMSQTRSFGRNAFARQGGWEVLEETGFRRAASQIGSEAIELLSAPQCPSGKMDVLIAPDQMVLQIHESIGHPLELDRILGDERNFAGTSFIRPEMFGSFRYGSELLNITFDPDVPGEFAAYSFDDEGTPAKKEYLIKAGILQRPEGSAISQVRAGLPGVANARAESWYRPPIDRMADINLEPGDSTFEEMVGSVQHGLYLQTNCSWSIDDSRNKFQFGCERGTLVEDGRLTSVVRNPNYRGISSEFWRSLKMVGNRDTVQMMGLRNCGKGEPNQIMFVGHCSPACLFSGVDVFGGE